MSSEAKDFYVRGPGGAILTRFWAGAHKAAYSPLTHFMIAAKCRTGVVLVVPEQGDWWTLPGGPVASKEPMVADAVARFEQQTGLRALRPSVMGYFRMVSSARVEYGALVICTCDEAAAGNSGKAGAELRTWDCKGFLEGLDPVSATLAIVAASSRAWRSDD